MKFLVIDGETCNTPIVDGQLDYQSGQNYDLGGKVIDEFGHVYDQFNLVIEEVFFGMKEQMQEAYYADKIPQYLEEMRMQQRKIVNIWEAYAIVRQMCKKWNITCIVAHNAKFDITTLNATLRYQTKSKRRFFFPYGTHIVDSMKVAKMVLNNNKNYIDFCETNGYVTNHKTPRPRYTAEILWRYFSNNNDFIEAHTGLADVEIESQIFVKCLEALRCKASFRRRENLTLL